SSLIQTISLYILLSFFTDTATTEIYTLSLHDALPISTHLELTMIHEVMVLDHGGPDFAFIMYGASLKLWVLGSLIVGLVIPHGLDRKSTRLNSSHVAISYAVFCLKKKTHKQTHLN